MVLQNIMYNSDEMNINELTRAMHDFVQDQGWYHPDSPRPQTPKNLAISLSIEAAEVLEHLQWAENPAHPGELAGELADVMLYLLQLASVMGVDLEEAVLNKLRVNAGRNWDNETEVTEENHEN